MTNKESYITYALYVEKDISLYHQNVVAKDWRKGNKMVVICSNCYKQKKKGDIYREVFGNKNICFDCIIKLFNSMNAEYDKDCNN